MQWLSRIGDAVFGLPISAGKFIDVMVDGRFGVGTAHSALLQIGLNKAIRPIFYTCLSGAIFACDQELAKDKDCPAFEKFVCCKICMPILWIGGVLELHVGLIPLTSEIAKRTLANTVLCAFDQIAIGSLAPQDNPSQAKRGLSALYLATRLLDLLVNCGGVGEELIRFNPQPLLNSLGSIKGWVV
jgi:hypothetical protein